MSLKRIYYIKIKYPRLQATRRRLKCFRIIPAFTNKSLLFVFSPQSLSKKKKKNSHTEIQPYLHCK